MAKSDLYYEEVPKSDLANLEIGLSQFSRTPNWAFYMKFVHINRRNPMVKSNLWYEKVPKTDLASLISQQSYLEFLILAGIVPSTERPIAD